MKLSLTFSTRLVLLFLLLILGMVLTGAFQFLLSRLTSDAVAATRIAIVVQDLLGFIIPALVTALLITRLPADFLLLRRAPGWAPLGWAAVALIAALPLIDGLNHLCEQQPWPQAVLDLEAQANAAAETVMGPHTGANLALSILIIGLLTGLAEELFFRGALQQIFITRPMPLHLAVWLAAFIFALMHGQMVGLLPRMLLGALFGYAAIYSGSLWTAVLLHALNNSIAVIGEWAGFTPEPSLWLSVASAAVAAAAFAAFCRSAKKKATPLP